jgi:phosphatidylserine/phosphatidylglycerophosphate/cardiolipin synthase-like enzyme
MRHLCPIVLAIALTGSALALPTDGVTVINSRDYYPAVLSLIEQAESSVTLVMHQTRFYMDYPGSDSNNLCDALVAASGRGVDVTFIIDMSESDWNNNNEENSDFGRRLADAGAAVIWDDMEKVTHTKLIVVDGVATVIASVNWSHYSLTSNNEVGVIVWGAEVAEAANAIAAEHAAAGEVQTECEGMGDMAAATDDIAAYASARGFEVLPCAGAELLFNADYYPAVSGLIASAESRVDVVQRSAVHYRLRPGHSDPPAEGQDAVSLTNALLRNLAAAAERGIEVVMTLEGGISYDDEPASNDNLDFGLRARSQGITVWWDPPESQTHAKMAMVDDTVVVGSTNWTIFAVEGQNNELSVALESPEVAEVYRGYIAALQASGERFTSDF